MVEGEKETQEEKKKLLSCHSYVPSATATSGLPVSFSVAPQFAGVCNFAGGTVRFVGAGTCVINFDQSGSATFNSAPQLQMIVVVGKGTPGVTFTSVAPTGVVVDNGANPYTVAAVSSVAGLTIAYDIDPGSAGVCAIGGTVVTFIGVGNCRIVASTIATADWNQGSVSQSLTVGRGSQVLSFTSQAPSGASVQGFSVGLYVCVCDIHKVLLTLRLPCLLLVLLSPLLPRPLLFARLMQCPMW